MIDAQKKELIDKIMPKAILIAQTDNAKHSMVTRMYGEDIIPIFKYPFRIGREARVEYVNGEIILQERHKLGGHEPNNDLYLLDNGQFLQISREHCNIVKQGDEYVLQDRGSACGSMVNQFKVGGGDNNGLCPLKDGDIVTLGADKSQYKYKFVTLDMLFK